MKDFVIINSAVGEWWTHGQDRLRKSLIDVGYDGDVMFFKNEQINGFYNPDNVYTTKAAALHEAIQYGYKYILWVDCSFWAIKNPKGVFDKIKKEHGYFLKSGYNCAQTTNDKAAKLSGYTHDELELLPELWSCMFGFDMTFGPSRILANQFLAYMVQGAAEGDREHNAAECSDPRFMFSRQDQTALSLAFHTCGWKTLNEPGVDMASHTMFDDGTPIGEGIQFLMRGM